ncbi:hypothetical protein EON83_18755 [bacterium]|nr:MAG: hypothetical protein EON83_18755 [bacterium]
MSAPYNIATHELKTRLDEHSLGASGIEQVVAAFEEAPVPFNAIFLMWNEEDFPQIETPTSVSKEGVQLRYMGRFDGSIRK